MREQRRLAAILSADVAGYSRLMGRDESGTLARLKAHRHGAVRAGTGPPRRTTGQADRRRRAGRVPQRC